MNSMPGLDIVCVPHGVYRLANITEQSKVREQVVNRIIFLGIQTYGKDTASSL